MAEIVKTYMLDNPDVLIPMDRGDFYDEQIKVFKETGKPSRAVDVVNIFIFNTEGELIIQKRSFDKRHNPGLLDKSIGGHITYGDNEEYVVMVETVQELQTPSIVLRNEDDFRKTYMLLNKYLETIAIVKHLDTKIFLFDKIINQEKIVIANRSHIYFGFYNGRIRPVDKEAKGVLFYGLDELRLEMQKVPEIFTPELRLCIDTYAGLMQDFIESASSKVL